MTPWPPAAIGILPIRDIRRAMGVMFLVGLLALLTPAAVLFGLAALFGWQAAVAAVLTPFAILLLFGLSRGIH